MPPSTTRNGAPPTNIETSTVMCGFGHDQILAVADKVVAAVILTAGCAKFRYNKLNPGDIGWYEQKTVCVLLHLGVKGIRLGPTLPAFLSPGVASVLTETFGIKGIGTVEEDVAAVMAGA